MKELTLDEIRAWFEKKQADKTIEPGKRDGMAIIETLLAHIETLEKCVPTANELQELKDVAEDLDAGKRTLRAAILKHIARYPYVFSDA